jgi:hypothetical protein
MRLKIDGFSLMIHAILILPMGFAGCVDHSPAIEPASSRASKFNNPAEADSVTVGVTSQGLEEYRVFEEAATGIFSIESLRAQAQKRATEFCDRMDKVMKSLRETTSKPGYSIYNTPRVEIVFTCVGQAPH